MTRSSSPTAARPGGRVPTRIYDGQTLPFPDDTVDVVLFESLAGRADGSGDRYRAIARSPSVAAVHLMDLRGIEGGLSGFESRDVVVRELLAVSIRD